MTKKDKNKASDKKDGSKTASDGKAERQPAPIGEDGFLVVGIGASAGGIGALKQFFENVKPDSGMAYVVILHLSPEHESSLAEVLQFASKIPVTQVSERVRVAPNHVYVVPPNKSMTMDHEHIALLPIKTVQERRAPVDIFFRTLAESKHSRAVAVVLSGTGANGSMGLKRVKERGGAAFVQNPSEAEFNEMPRNSIATDLVDAILPVAMIPARIAEYGRSLGIVQIPVEPTDREEDQQQALREIFTQLRLRTGHDFSNYKRATVLRRIERRISVSSLLDLPAYAHYVKENPEEPRALLKDLLISVTNFFRDPKPWEFIEKEVVPQVLAAKKAGEPVRIWTVGCATGEEAYSLAMLFAERTLGNIDAPPVQIFATDIDENAIAIAREGVYTLNDAADVSPERLRRFFTKEADGYRVRRELREMILFAVHNALKDPPFSHLDLVSCRNMLIYLNGIAQERVLESIHFGLDPGGFLVIGTSESVDGSGDLFAVVNKESHVFQSRQVAARPYPIPDMIPSFRGETPKPDRPRNTDENALERITYGDLHRQLLEQYAPPSVVVNEDYTIMHLSENAGRYMRVAGGEPTNNLLDLVNPDLRLELRSVLYQAVHQASNVEARSIKVAIDGKDEMVDLLVRPVLGKTDTARGFILVIFQPADESEDREQVVYSPPEPLARQLEDELVRSKAQLRASLEHAEIQTEELRASNEELQAMNEELRSSAEELETSKEELQSINEELVTVNQELKIKIDELSQSNNNFQNLLNSTDIATIFLDRAFRVKLFSPATRSIFNLLPTDIGRPLSDITGQLEYDGLVADAETVLDKLRTVEHEVRTKDGTVFLRRILPYRTSEDQINGVVVIFVDITERKKAEDRLRESEARYRTLFKSMDEGYCVLQVQFDESGKPTDAVFLDANPAFQRHYGRGAAVGQTVRDLTPELEEKWIDVLGNVALTGESTRFEEESEALGRWLDTFVVRVSEAPERKVAMLFSDVTERKKNEERLRLMADINKSLSS